MKDKTQEYTHLWPQLSNDGHPSYCPTDNNLVIFDTYPSRCRVQELKLGYDTDTTGESVKTIVKVFLLLNMTMILVVIYIRVGDKTERRYVLIAYLKDIEGYMWYQFNKPFV